MMYCSEAQRIGIDWDEWLECSELEKRREYRKEIVRKSQRRRRAKARKTEMCSQCCKGIPEKGRKTCPACLEKARERMRRIRKSTI